MFQFDTSQRECLRNLNDNHGPLDWSRSRVGFSARVSLVLVTRTRAARLQQVLCSILKRSGNFAIVANVHPCSGGVQMPSTLTDQATATRDLARRARRLAGTLTIADDTDRLLRYAEELEAQAVDLDQLAKKGG
jgi:hypothetical protein